VKCSVRQPVFPDSIPSYFAARNRVVLCAILLLSFVQASCRKRQPVAPIAPAPVVDVAPALTPAPATPPGSEPSAETTPNPPPAAATPPAPASVYQQNRPAAQDKPPKKTPRVTVPPPPVGAPAATAPSPPRLGAILTPEQQREFNTAIDQSLSRVKGSLDSIGNRQLTGDQQSRVDQVQAFVKQAQETRKSDLSAAKSLAERAEVLASDLAASFR
jgi:hypothetical protein